jgi:hypothetical protein
MSKTEATKTGIETRFISPIQSTGRAGKSFTIAGIKTALQFQGVVHATVDADTKHETLFRKYGKKEVVQFDATGSLDGFARMIKQLPTAPVILVDFPAQVTAFLLDASLKLQLMDFLESKSIRPTFLIFASDDDTAMESAGKATRHFGDRANYLLVENTAKSPSVNFRKTPLYRWFLDRNTPILEVPHVTPSTMDAWSAAERKTGKYIPLDEARTHEAIDGLSQRELAYLRHRFLVQCEDFADWLLPNSSLIKNKVVRPAAAVAAPEVEFLTDPLLHW